MWCHKKNDQLLACDRKLDRLIMGEMESYAYLQK